MPRKKDKPIKDYEFTVDQEVVRKGVDLKSFDVMLRFKDDTTQPELFMDELVETLLKGLLARYGEIIVKFNWWDEGLSVIAPNEIPASNQTYDALQGHSETRTGTVDS